MSDVNEAVATNPDDWITSDETAQLLGISRSGALWHANERKTFTTRKDGGRMWFRRSEVEAFAAAARERGAGPVHVSPLAELVLRGLAQGTIHDRNGRAVAVLADRLTDDGYGRQSITSIMPELERHGLVRRSVNGKRTRTLALTAAGKAWLDAHESDEPTPAPEITDNGDTPLHAAGGALVRADEHGPNGATAPDVDDDFLRRLVYLLSESHVATIAAERDLLRQHNAALTGQLNQLRGDLLGLVGEAARWAI
jgi:hypothetical protein